MKAVGFHIFTRTILPFAKLHVPGVAKGQECEELNKRFGGGMALLQSQNMVQLLSDMLKRNSLMAHIVCLRDPSVFFDSLWKSCYFPHILLKHGAHTSILHIPYTLLIFF